MLSRNRRLYRSIKIRTCRARSWFGATLRHCITLHPGFGSVCLAPWSLRQAGRKFRKLDGRKYTVQNDENRLVNLRIYLSFWLYSNT